MALRIPNKPGTNITKVLTKFGIRTNEGCGCKRIAYQMDQDGSEKVLETWSPNKCK